MRFTRSIHHHITRVLTCAVCVAIWVSCMRNTQTERPLIAWHPLPEPATLFFEDAPYYPANTPFFVSIPGRVITEVGKLESVVLSVESESGDSLSQLKMSVPWPAPEQIMRVLRLPEGDQEECFTIRLRTSNLSEVTRSGSSDTHRYDTEIAAVNLTRIPRYRQTEFRTGFFESDSSSHQGRWCRSSGLVTIPFPLFPGFIVISGHAPIDCFDGKSWMCHIRDSQKQLRSIQIEKSDFCESAMIDPTDFWVLRSQESVLDVKRMYPDERFGVSIESDREFVPLNCDGSNDRRTLSFCIRDVRWEASNPLRGISRELTSGNTSPFWTHPGAAFQIPNRSGSNRLIIQGIRLTECISEAQELIIRIDGEERLRESISGSDFFFEIPVEFIENGTLAHLVEMDVSPIFFMGQCRETADSMPYGIGITEIFLCRMPSLE